MVFNIKKRKKSFLTYNSSTLPIYIDHFALWAVCDKILTFKEFTHCQCGGISTVPSNYSDNESTMVQKPRLNAKQCCSMYTALYTVVQ